MWALAYHGRVLRLLGPPTVQWEGASLPWPRTRPGALLAYLAYRAEWVRRDELALLLRPDVPDAEARRYLRQLIHRATRFAWADRLEVADDRLRWHVASDVQALRSALAEHDATALLAATPASLLDGFAPPGVPAFDAWLELERESFAVRWRDALVRLAETADEAGDARTAITARERVLDVAPLEEATVQALMRACLRAGMHERAVAAFERFAGALAREVEVPPLDTTLALVDAARRGAGGRTPAPGRERPRVEAPRPASCLVGRSSELERLQAWLDEGARFVTICGLGGVGKTRLALELAHSAGPRFAAGARFVPLAGCASVADVLTALVSRLGLVSDDAPADEAIASHVHDAATLVVLDEAEHLPAAALGAQLGRLLEVASGLRLVLTARAPLGLAVEHVLPLAGLQVGPATDADPGQGALDEACTLFFERAAQAGVSLLADAATTRSVRALCAELDGLPLAIELAAGRARTRSVGALLAEVRVGVDDLRTDAPDVPTRHRSLEHLVRQAWEALSPSSRAVLERLAVFRTCFSIEAARAVAGADLDTLLALLQRSLVRRVDDDRFELHTLVARAAARPPDEGTRDAHATFVLAWLASLTPELIGGSAQAQAVAQVHAALPDVRQAWSRALERGMLAPLAEALQPLEHVLHARNSWDLAEVLYVGAVAALGGDTGPSAGEGRPSADESRSSAGDGAARHLWARLQVRLANAERYLQRTDSARGRLRHVLAAAARGPYAPPSDVLDDGVDTFERVRLEALLELAKLDEIVRVYDAARHGYEAVLAAARPGRDDDLLVQAHTGLCNLAFAVGGDLDHAMEHGEAAVRVARGLGDRDLLSVALVNLGAGHHDMGRLRAARRHWREAAELAATLGHRQREAAVLNNLAAVSQALGEGAAAREAFERSLALRYEVGDRTGAARVLLNLGRLAQREGALEEADTYVEAAVGAYEQVDDPADLAWALAVHARIRVELDDLRAARRDAERALRLGRSARDRVAMLAGLLAAAAIHGRGDRVQAAALARFVAAHTADRDAGLHASATALLADLGGDTVGEAPTAIDSEGVPRPLEQAVATALEALAGC